MTYMYDTGTACWHTLATSQTHLTTSLEQVHAINRQEEKVCTQISAPIRTRSPKLKNKLTSSCGDMLPCETSAKNKTVVSVKRRVNQEELVVGHDCLHPVPKGA